MKKLPGKTPEVRSDKKDTKRRQTEKREKNKKKRERERKRKKKMSRDNYYQSALPGASDEYPSYNLGSYE